MPPGRHKTSLQYTYIIVISLSKKKQQAPRHLVICHWGTTLTDKTISPRARVGRYLRNASNNKKEGRIPFSGGNARLQRQTVLFWTDTERGRAGRLSERASERETQRVCRRQQSRKQIPDRRQAGRYDIYVTLLRKEHPSYFSGTIRQK